MSVVAADLVVIASANMPEDDSSTSGGAADESVKMTFTDIDITDTLNMVSDTAGDAGVFRVFGKDATGADITEDFTISGTSVQAGTLNFRTIDKIVKQSGSRNAGATVTVYRTSTGAPLATLEAVNVSPTGVEIDAIRKIFFDVASGAAQIAVHEKVFYHNENATFTLSDANVQIVSFTPPGTLVFALALEDSLDGSESVSDRIDDEPSNIVGGSFQAAGTDIAVPNSQNHSPGSNAGCWIKMTVPIGHAAVVSSTFTLQETGNTL